MGEDIPDVGPRACCVLHRPFDCHGPWICPHCGLMHGWPCEPTRSTRIDTAEFWLAVRLADVRDLSGKHPNLPWPALESELIDTFSALPTRWLEQQ